MILPPSQAAASISAHDRSHRSPELRRAAGSGLHVIAREAAPSPPWSYLELAALPTAPSCARLHTKQVLWERGLAGLSETCELIVSELMTNAVQVTAARGLLTPVRLWLSSYGQRTLIEVWDGDPQPPVLELTDTDDLSALEAEGGRGLFLVASLSERWGWYPERFLGGKVVWGEVEMSKLDFSRSA